MNQDTFDTPSLHLNRIYTKAGDSGETRLAGGQRIRKDDPRIECYGTVDELNSFVGLARTSCENITSPNAGLQWLATVLKRVQHELFNLGSLLATLPEDLHPKQARITAADVQQMEHDIDRCNDELPALRSFVLPGGTRLDAELHVCRTICRRAERLLVALAQTQEIDPNAIKYLNRLSDALFVWSRWANHVSGAAETLWEPNEAAGGRAAEA